MALLVDGTNWAESKPKRRRLRCFLHALACTWMSLCLRAPPRAAAEHKEVIRWFRKNDRKQPQKGRKSTNELLLALHLQGSVISSRTLDAISSLAHVGQGARRSQNLDTP